MWLTQSNDCHQMVNRKQRLSVYNLQQSQMKGATKSQEDTHCISFSVSIQTRQQAGRPRFDSRQGHDGFFLSQTPRPDRLWGPPSLLANVYGELFPRQ
jgi:hypothetical protein